MSNPLSHVGQTARPEDSLRHGQPWQPGSHPQQQQSDGDMRRRAQQQQRQQRRQQNEGVPPERGGTDTDASQPNDDDL